MPAYAYAIKVNPQKQRIHFREYETLTKETLTLEDLKFIGNRHFEIRESESGGYTVALLGSRLETDKEQFKRHQRELAYMAEYNRRKAIKKS